VRDQPSGARSAPLAGLVLPGFHGSMDAAGMSRKPQDLGLRRFADLGLRMAAAILLFTYLGHRLDEWLDTRPVFLLVLGFLGLAGGMASVYYTIYPRRQEPDERPRRDGDGHA